MISKDFQRQLFKEELDVLEEAMSIIDSGKYKDKELFMDFENLVESYEKLLNIIRKIVKISDSQAKNLLWRESEIKSLLDNAGQGFLTFGNDFIVNREYSAECRRLFEKDISRSNILELLAGDDQENTKELEGSFQAIFETNDLELKQQYINESTKVIKLGQKYLDLKIKLINHLEDNTQLIMLILTDITDRYQAEKQIEFLSHHDKLTTLYNRTYVDKWIASFNAKEHFPLSVVVADMNGLKLANDIFGHLQGDKLLAKLAQVLSASTRASDVIARWGGDEFLILLPGTDAKDCTRICERIKENCKKIKDLPIELSVALGAATQNSTNNNIVDLFNIAENRMYSDKMLESSGIRRQLKTLHTRFFEDSGHIKRVEKAVLRFAKKLGLKDNSIEVQYMQLLARLHDIGKITIPKEILGKKGPLTDDEWEIIKSHSEIGYRMAQSIGETVVAEAILAMHERWDGKGYPRYLEKEEIPFLARMFQIVDVYDVMTHLRPYRKAKLREEAIEELKKNQGSQFDPELLDIFLSNLEYITKG